MRRATAFVLVLAGGLAWALRDHSPLRAAPAHAGASAVDDRADLLGPFGLVVARMAPVSGRDLGIDVRVATRRDGTTDVAALAEQLFRALRVGEGAPTGGILIVLETQRRLARIEVSYTLEGVFPDAFLARLARDQLVPYAADQAAGMAVMDVVHLLRDRALDAVASGQLEIGEELRHAGGLARSLAGRSGGAGAQVAIPDLPPDLDLKRAVPAADRARYAPSADPRASAEAYRQALLDLAGDPTLELFTPGSRCMRARGPVAPYEDRLRADAIVRSQPLALRVAGERALLDAAHPARGFVPVLLVRMDGLWRVDLVETYKSFQFDDAGRFRLVNASSPYASLVDRSVAAEQRDLEPVALRDESIEAALARLEHDPSPQGRFQLAELLLRNCWDTVDAMPLYAEAARLAPGEWRIAGVLAERAAYLGMPELAIPAVSALGPRAAATLGWLHERAGRRDEARVHYESAVARGVDTEFARRALERMQADAD